MKRKEVSLQRISGFKIRDYVLSISFLLPSTLLLVYTVFYALANSVYGTFFEYNGISPKMEFVGLDNYKYVFTDVKFGVAIKNNFIWLVMHLFQACFLGLVLSFLISQIAKGKFFFRTILFLPYVVAISVSGLIWRLVFNSRIGAIVSILRLFLSDTSWFQPLADMDAAIWAAALAGNWRMFGYYMVLFLAGLQNIDPNLYDAAEIDGANNWHKFISVTIPGLKNVFTFVLSIALILGLRGFGTVWVMTRGGPGYSSYLVAIYGYIKAFQEMRMGLAMVSGIIIGIIIVIITVAFNIIREKAVDY